MDSLSTPVEPTADIVTPADIGPLLSSARSGCAASLGELAERYRRYLLLVANYELSSELNARVGASDLVQETLLYVQQSIDRFVGTSEAELLSWLRKILHFRALQAVRHHNAAVRQVACERPIGQIDETGKHLHPVDAHATPCTQLAQRERLAALDIAVARLPEDYQQIIALRNERQSFERIGQVFGCSADAAQKRWMRAIVRLRQDLGEHA